MDRWDVLRQEERVLIENEEKLNQDSKQVHRIKDSYEEHFHEANRFLEDLEYTFHKNDGGYFYESIKSEFTHESNVILSNLFEEEQEISTKKRKVQQAIDDIVYEKKNVEIERRGKAT